MEVNSQQAKMSEEQVKAFIATVAHDAVLQEKLNAEGANPALIALEAGFQLRKADLMRYQASQVLQLSDEELESASAGILSWSYFIGKSLLLNNLITLPEQAK